MPITNNSVASAVASLTFTEPAPAPTPTPTPATPTPATTEYLAFAYMGSSMSRTKTPWGVKINRTFKSGQVEAEWAGWFKTESEAAYVANRLNVLFGSVK